MADFCHIWIPNFGLIAKSPGDKLQGQDTDPFEWDEQCEQAFKRLKELLMSASALGLSDLTKTLDLCMLEKQGVALGVLTQML